MTDARLILQVDTEAMRSPRQEPRQIGNWRLGDMSGVELPRGAGIGCFADRRFLVDVFLPA
jgi:hypothetical protein